MSSETFYPDNLRAGDYPMQTSSETLGSSENLGPGVILGKKTVGAVATTGLADAGNTGDGTCTGVTAGAKVKAGGYTLNCVLAATNGGTFEVMAPDGRQIGLAMVGVAFTSDEINLTINDGTTDFAVGDIFTITTPAGAGTLASVNSAAVDGTAIVHSVLLESTDASGGDVACPVALTGEFNSNALSVGGSDTVAQHKDAMRELNMFQVDPITHT